MSLPYGFMPVSGTRIIVDPEKANIVKTIFQQYISGMSLGGIADFLFEHGILSPKGKERWTQPVLNNLLSNEKYMGDVVLGKAYVVDGVQVKSHDASKQVLMRAHHPAIIPHELLNAVQQEKRKRGRCRVACI